MTAQQTTIMTSFSAKKGYFKNFWKYAGLFHLLYVVSAELVRYLRDDPRTVYYYLIPVLISLTTVLSFVWQKWPDQLEILDNQKTIRITYYFLFFKKTLLIKFEDFNYFHIREIIRSNKSNFTITIFDKAKKIVAIKPNYYWSPESIKRINFELISRNILASK